MRRWCAALAGCIAVFLLVPVSTVAAHASLVGSNPVDGSVLAASPVVAELRFTESVLADASSVSLLHLGTDQTMALTLSTVDGGRTLVVDVPRLERGAYILRFVAVDPADLHKTVGSISFGVGVAAPPSESAEQVDGSWLTIILRFVTNAALLLVVGAATIVVLLARGRQHNVDLDRVARLLQGSSWVLAVGWIGLLGADVATVGFGHVRWASLLLSSDPGRRAVVGVQLAVGMWWTIRMLRTSHDSDTRWFVVRILAAIVGGFVLAAAYGGHAGIGGAFAVGFALRVMHLGSLGTWIGTLAAMWLLGRRDRGLRALWPRISRLAVVGLAGTGASGLLLSGRVAATVTALLGTAYGQRIVVKFGLLLVLAVFGGAAALRVRRGGEPHRLSVELAVAAAALAVAAVLASTAPAQGEQFRSLPVDTPQITTSDVADLTVSASVEPARPGANLVQVRVLETRRPSYGTVESVAVKLLGADGVSVAERDGVPVDGLIEWPDVAIPNPGTYRVEVEVARPSAPVDPVVGSWSVSSAPVPRASRVVSTRSWAPLATILASAWILLLVVGWWTIQQLGRHGRRRQQGDASGDRSFGPIGPRWLFNSRRPWHDSNRRGEAPSRTSDGQYTYKGTDHN